MRNVLIKLAVLLIFAGVAYLGWQGFPSRMKYPSKPQYALMPKRWRTRPVPASWQRYEPIALYGGVAGVCLMLVLLPSGGVRFNPVICAFMGFKWRLDDFPRGWLITGRTGSGKTAAAIAHIIHGLFKNARIEKGVKKWGGMALDLKGNFFVIFEKIAAAYGTACRLCTIAVRPDSTLPCPEFEFELPEAVCGEAGTAYYKLVEKIEEKLPTRPTLGELILAVREIKESGTIKNVSYEDGYIYFIRSQAEGVLAILDDGERRKFDELITGQLLGEVTGDEVDSFVERAREKWKPKFKYNFLSYPGIPNSTYAKIIMDAGKATGSAKGGDDFFEKQCAIQIEKAIDFLQVWQEIDKHPDTTSFVDGLATVRPEGEWESDREVYDRIPKFVAMQNIYTLITDLKLLEHAINIARHLVNSERYQDKPQLVARAKAVANHFETAVVGRGGEQTEGVLGNVENALQHFTAPEIVEVFGCEENTVDIEEMDRGKIFTVSLPQRFATERTYVNTLMKLIFYTHVQARFDRPGRIDKNNLLVLFADEAQGLVTASGGMSDYNVVDKIREARGTVVFATQSITSFSPVMSQDQAKTMLLNLANQVHFEAADEDAAKMIANEIGSHTIKKTSRTISAKGGVSRTINEKEEHILKPHQLRDFRKFECVAIHCEDGSKRGILKPITPDGKVPKYYKYIKRGKKKRAK